MSKKKRQRLSAEEREQRQMLKVLRDELHDLHEISLILMADEGILPPFYAGEHLGEDREIIPLWGMDGEKPELGAVLVRAVESVEPEIELQRTRAELGLTNDWPVSELLDMLAAPDGKTVIEGADKLREMSILLMLDSSQIHPAPGFDGETMIEFMTEMLPYAIFIKIPTSGKDESLTYLWDDLDKYTAEVVYAESEQLLEAAIWEYRVNFALRTESAEIMAEGLDPAEELIGLNAAEMAALFEILVMGAYRLYGTTSAIRARQTELDVLREENGDLLVKAPLKPEIEPIPLMAESRSEVQGDENGIILHIKSDSDIMQKVWPTIRSHNLFSIRVRHGAYMLHSNGRLGLGGYRPEPMLEWLMAESLPEMYRCVRLANIYEMLACCDMVKAKVRS